MKTYYVEIEGITPLMHHKMREEDLLKLLGSKSSKKKVKEDLLPREIAEQHAYKTDDGYFYIPLEYISSAFIHISGDYKQSNSTRKSYKSVAGGIFRPLERQGILTTKNNEPLKTFEVDIRKGTNHNNRAAVAICRPRFDEWKTKFHVSLDESIISSDVALQILQDSGKRAGIGSFRVANRGFYGQFSVIEWKEVK